MFLKVFARTKSRRSELGQGGRAPNAQQRESWKRALAAIHRHMASNASLPARGLPPKPPDKGSFPLDHFRECSEVKTKYLACLRENNMVPAAEECRELSAKYLECRMDAKLMAKQDLSELGYYKTPEATAESAHSTPPPAAAASTGPQRDAQYRRGYIAGIPASEQNK